MSVACPAPFYKCNYFLIFFSLIFILFFFSSSSFLPSCTINSSFVYTTYYPSSHIVVLAFTINVTNSKGIYCIL